MAEAELKQRILAALGMTAEELDSREPTFFFGSEVPLVDEPQPTERLPEPEVVHHLRRVLVPEGYEVTFEDPRAEE